MPITLKRFLIANLAALGVTSAVYLLAHWTIDSALYKAVLSAASTFALSLAWSKHLVRRANRAADFKKKDSELWTVNRAALAYGTLAYTGLFFGLCWQALTAAIHAPGRPAVVGYCFMAVVLGGWSIGGITAIIGDVRSAAREGGLRGYPLSILVSVTLASLSLTVSLANALPALLGLAALLLVIAKAAGHPWFGTKRLW
ncbi:MAG: hypothetical protein PHT12_01310 [Patescibacteria group bacterium]|nr:hypothetical protein [Patescibacteria group bacterium]